MLPPKMATPLALASAFCHVATIAVIGSMHIQPSTLRDTAAGPQRSLLESPDADALVSVRAQLEGMRDEMEEMRVDKRRSDERVELLSSRVDRLAEELRATHKSERTQGPEEAEAQQGLNTTHRQMQQGAAGSCDASGVCTARIITRTVVMQSAMSAGGGAPQRGRRAQAAPCDFAAESAAVMDVCCATVGGGHRRAQADCPLPEVCPSARCAEVFQPFYSGCSAELEASPELGAGIAALSASCNELLGGSSLAHQLNLQCTDTSLTAEDCVPPCNAEYHGYMLLLNIDGDDSKFSCNLAHGLYSWMGAASEGGYLGADFASFFSAVVSGAAGAYFVTLTRDANMGTQLTIRPGQSASMTGDRMLAQPPLFRNSGITVQERGLLTLAYVEFDGEIRLDPTGRASLTDVFCSSAFWSASPHGPRSGTAVGETDGTYTIEPPQLGLIGIFASGFSIGSGPCTVSDDMKCVGRPNGYFGNEQCMITVLGGGGVLGPCHVFDTRLPNPNIHQDGDIVTLPDGSEHCGSDCPMGVVLAPGDTVTWRSDPTSQGSGGRDSSQPTWRGNGCADKGLCGLPYSEMGLGGGWQICIETGVLGCTTPGSSNYDPSANIDDGSCQ